LQGILNIFPVTGDPPNGIADHFIVTIPQFGEGYLIPELGVGNQRFAAAFDDG
jgi:hypothetical protein